MTEILQSFKHNGTVHPVKHSSFNKIAPGMVCDGYDFTYGDGSRDLGIVSLEAGHQTPLQKVVGGDRTIAALMDGQATLVVTDEEGVATTYDFSDPEGQSDVTITPGQMMQWTNIGKTVAKISEIYIPPFVPGRFETVTS